MRRTKKLRLLLPVVLIFLSSILDRVVSAQTANVVFNAQILCKNFENIRCAAQFPGSDLGAKVAAADTDLGSNAGEIWIDSSAGTTWTTTVTFSAPRILRFINGGTYTIPTGAVLSGNHPYGVDCGGRQEAVLVFTGSGTAFLLNWATTSTGSYLDAGYGLHNCQIIGPGGGNGSNTLNTGTGIQIGDATHATIWTQIENVNVNGFATGITWGSCSSWGTKVRYSSFLNNTQDLLHNTCSGGGAENLSFEHDVFGWTNTNTMQPNGVQFGGTGIVEADFLDTSFDGDQVVNSGPNNLKFVDCHFENPVGSTTNYFYVQTASATAQTTMFSPFFQQDSSSGGVVPTAFVQGGSGDFYVVGVQGNTNERMPEFFNIAGTIGFDVSMEKEAGTFTNGTYAGTNTGWTIVCPDVNQNCIMNNINLRQNGSGFQTSVGRLNQSLAGQYAASLTLSSGTATFTYPTGYTSTPVCALGPGVTGNTYKCVPGTSSAVVTSSSGSDTSTIGIVIVGNPN
jgi:hypothetical protein